MGQAGRLLRWRLGAFFASDRQADRLAYRDLFRHAARHGLMEPETVERWLRYHDNLKDIAHEHGEGFAEATLGLLPAFVADAGTQAAVIEAACDD